MNDELKALIGKADCGDSEAQKELMERGDAAGSAGDHEQAAYLYKMAAMAYRISAGRQGTLSAEADGRCTWMEVVLQLYREWIATYTKPVAPRINRLKRIRGNFDRPILTLRRDGGKFSFMLRYLEKQLMEHDIEICAPGGTINRHFYYMVNQHEAFTGFMNDIDVRVVLDPIADEVLRQITLEGSSSVISKAPKGKKP